MPGRRDIDPIEISREVLPNIALIGVRRPPGFKMRCRSRLVGTSIVQNFGLEVTGCLFEEVLLSPDKLKVECVKIERVVQTRDHFVVLDRLNISGRQFVTVTQTLLLLVLTGATSIIIWISIERSQAARRARSAAVGRSLSLGATLFANSRILRSASSPDIPAYPKTPIKPSAPVWLLISTMRS